MSWVDIVIDIFVYSLLFYSVTLLFSYISIGLYSIGAVRQYLHKNSFTDYRILAVSPEAPSMSIIAPAYNEGATVVENARSLLSIHYNNLEVIIVNDGSKDDCLQKLIDNFDLKKIDFFYNEQISTKKVRGIYKSTNQVYRKLVVVDKENGGKADALNVGINISSNDYIVCIDVDCILEQDALLKLAKPFLETTKERVIATGGVVRIANGCEIEDGRLIKVSLANGFLPRMQTLEYIRAFLLGRMAWSRINGLLLISGAFGAFDKEIVINCGGYNHKTVGEDMELVVRMRRYMEEQKVPYRVTFIPDPLCWTEAPACFKILGRQRNRWTRGTIETLLFHKKMFFNPKYGLVGMLSYPYWFFFEFLSPIFEFFGIIAFIFCALFAETDWKNFFYLLSFILSFGFLYSVFAILMEVMTYNQYKSPKDIFRLILTALLEPFIFHPFVVWSAIQGNVDFLQKKSAWGEMTRQGFAAKKLGVPTVTVEAVKEVAQQKEEKQSLVQQWLDATQAFAAFSVSWLLITLLFALFEVNYIGFMQEYPEEISKMIPAAFRNAALFWLKYNILLYLPYLLVYRLSKSAAKIAFSSLIVFFSIVQIMLIEYFSVSLIPLGADLYSYSKSDIRQTLGASGGINIVSITNMVCTLTVTVGIILAFSKKVKLHSYLAALLPFASLALLFLGTSSFRSSPFSSDFANNITLNKSDFFISETFKHFFPSNIENTDLDGFDNVNASKQVPFEYVDEEQYPFLHIDNTPDVLSPFFNQSGTTPNVVILLVEGLGRAFTNEEAYLGNFTPFLDSLSQKSLYWTNFLSQGGRTFAVLPSLLGSLPFGRAGFLEQGNKIPDHLSLLNILKGNGYNTAFYYGGDSEFDNMDAFLQANATDAIYDEKTFPESYKKMPLSDGGFTWGYGDSELFRRYFELNATSDKPRLDILLTVSTHSPFKINEQNEFLSVFEKRMRTLKFDEKKKKLYRNNDLKYASILYADNSLKKFFEEYSKRADYQNTIFFITGDHRMPELPMSSKIDRYHVPLIVYSPMLKRTAKFASVSSHYDVAPSILAFLNKNYNIKKPAAATWLGDGLDTARAFRNIHSYPLIQTKTSIIDYVMGPYHLNNETLFKLSSNMDENRVIENVKLKQIKAQFNAFKIRNDKFARGAKLMPDSLYRKYSGQ